MSTEREYWYLKSRVEMDGYPFYGKSGWKKSLEEFSEDDFFARESDAYIRNSAAFGGDIFPRINLTREGFLKIRRTRLKTELKAVEKELNSIAYKKMVERSNAANDETID